MKIVIAPDSYKESLSALEMATTIGQGSREIWPDANYVKIPIAGGGEGTIEAMAAATQGHFVHTDVISPLGNIIQVFYGLSSDERSAFIEMAAASGLEQVPVGLHDPPKTTSWGTEELIRHVLGAGTEHIITGVGDSATNDGGAGMAQALRAKLLDAQNSEIAQGEIGLESLSRVDISQLDSRLAGCCIEIACDMTSLLIEKKDASAVFGPQEEATPEMITRLGRALMHYAQFIVRGLDVNVLDLTGGGAAGGMGAALYTFCGAKLRCDTKIVTDALHLDAYAVGADLVATGEGCIDSRTIHGKASVSVTKVVERYSKPVIGITGSLMTNVDMVHEYGLGAVLSVIYTICMLDEALKNASDDVRVTMRNMVATLKAGQQLR